jgi:hypothetical protein
MRQRTKLAAALFVLALVLSGVVIGGVELFRQDAQDEARNNIEQSAKTVASQTEEEIHLEIDRMEILSSSSGIERRTAIGRNLSEFTRHSRFRVAIFVAPNGTIIEAKGIQDVNRSQIIGADVSDQPYIAASLNRDETRAEVGPPAWDSCHSTGRFWTAGGHWRSPCWPPGRSLPGLTVGIDSSAGSFSNAPSTSAAGTTS